MSLRPVKVMWLEPMQVAELRVRPRCPGNDRPDKDEAQRVD